VNSDLFTIRAMKVLSDSSGLAAGDNGVILSYGKPLHSDNNDDENEPPEVPGKLVLYQNYPNPFNPKTTIRFYLNEQVSIRLDVFDLTGKRLQSLNQGVQTAGFHNLFLNLDGFATGMYIYAIYANGQYRAHGKMLFVK
jgi:hypothetical protein